MRGSPSLDRQSRFQAPAGFATADLGPPSSAYTAESAERPSASSRAALTGSSAGGASSPPAPTSTAGIPRAPTGPVRHRRAGIRVRERRERSGAPLMTPVCWAIAAATVLCSSPGAEPAEPRTTRPAARPCGCREIAEDQRGIDRPSRSSSFAGHLCARSPDARSSSRHANQFARVCREVRGAPVPARAAAGGDQHDRALCLAGGQHPREFEQRRGPRQLRLCAPAGGIAVGEDHDRRLPRGARPLRDHGRERALPFDRRRAPDAAGAHREATLGGASQTTQRLCHILGEPLVARAAGAAFGKLPGEPLRAWRRRARLRRLRERGWSSAARCAR